MGEITWADRSDTDPITSQISASIFNEIKSSVNAIYGGTTAVGIQELSFDPVANTLSIGSGNSVDLSVLNNVENNIVIVEGLEDGGEMGGDLNVSGHITGSSFNTVGAGIPTIISDTNLQLSASNAVVVTNSPLRLRAFTTDEINGLIANKGDLVYNSTEDKFYGYNGAWIALH